MAVDPQGYIWGVQLLQQPDHRVHPLRVPTGEGSYSPFPCKLAIGRSRKLLHPGAVSTNVRKYDTEGHFLYDFIGDSDEAVAVDRSTGNLYVLEPLTTRPTTRSTTPGEPPRRPDLPRRRFTRPGTFGENALTSRESTKEVYVNNSHGYGGVQHVEVFKETATAVVPTVNTDAPDYGTSQRP